jgi:hypothetical protein
MTYPRWAICSHPATLGSRSRIPTTIGGKDVRDIDLFKFYAHESTRLRAPVTVTIGVLCDFRFSEGPCIILAADDKSIVEDPPKFANNACGKFHDTIPFAPLGIAISGNISVCDGVVSSFCDQLNLIKKKREEENDEPIIRGDDLRDAILEAKKYEYSYFFNDLLLGHLGMTRDQYLAETNPEKKRKGRVVARAACLYFPVWLIVGGFIGKNWVLMKSSGACVTEMGGQCFAAGIGDGTALKKLFECRYEPYMSAPRTLLHVAEAMEAARVAYPESIGVPSDYLVLRPNRPMMRFKRDSPALQEWLKPFCWKRFKTNARR